MIMLSVRDKFAREKTENILRIRDNLIIWLKVGFFSECTVHEIARKRDNQFVVGRS